MKRTITLTFVILAFTLNCTAQFRDGEWVANVVTDSIELEINYEIKSGKVDVYVTNYYINSIFVDSIGYSKSWTLDGKSFTFDQKSNTNPHTLKKLYVLKMNESFHLKMEVDSTAWRDIEFIFSYLNKSIVMKYTKTEENYQKLLTKGFIEMDREWFFQDAIDISIKNYK